MIIGRNLKILPNEVLVYFWKIEIIAKCNIAKILQNIPIMDTKNIAKKTTYGVGTSESKFESTQNTNRHGDI